MGAPDRINKLLKQASEELRAGRHKLALRAARTVLDAAPDNAPALFISGMAEQARGRTDAAIDFFERAAKADPAVPQIRFNLGAALGQAGRTDEAEAALTEAHRLAPDDVNILANLGRALYANEKWQAAAETLTRASKAAPGHAGILEQLGAARQQAGDLDGAVAAYRRALRISDNPQTWYSLGTALSRRFDIEGALEAYKKAVALRADHALAQRNLGHLLSKAGRFEEAVDPLRRAHRAIAQDPGIAYDLGYALSVTGRHDDAVRVLGALTQHHPDTADFTALLALAHFRKGEAETALEWAERTLQIRPGDNNGLAYKAMALNELERFDEARPLYDVDRLVMAERCAPPDGYADIESFNADFVRLIEDHATLSYSPLNRSLKGGQSTRELLDGDAPAARGFRQMLERTVARYLELHPADADHPFLQRRPERTETACWANIIDAGGFQDVHFHPASWLSGVYYPRLPAVVADAAREPEGWLEFGRAYYMLDARTEPPVRLVRPEEGLIVLFPAYFGHRTIPFSSDEKRVSVAFDVMPAESAVGF